MTKYWREYPPIHILKALELEYKPPAEIEEDIKVDMEQMFESVPMSKFPKPTATI